MAPTRPIFSSACTDASPEAADRQDGLPIEAPDPRAEMLERLRRIHQAARHVLDDSVSPRRLGHDKLKQLQASVLRQASEARVLQDRLSEIGADEAHRAELADLIGYFDTILAAIARQLSA